MIQINIKPLSVNRVWQGRRFKTKEYKKYEQDVLAMLPELELPEDKLFIAIKFGMSSKLSDVDNPTKPFIDILQKRYNFNDNRVYGILVLKEVVDKGKEFIKFKVVKHE